MSDSPEPVNYQLKVVLLGISPMIWRRILVLSDSTIEDLHYTLQISMGWEDIHLHHFIIHGKQYGVTQPGGTTFSTRACEVKLSTFGWQLKEKFLYEYDFSICPSMGTWRYWWRHQIRLEAISAAQAKQTYPVCTGGKGVCPPEDCGGAWGFMETRQEYSGWHILERFGSMLEEEDWTEYREELCQLQTWLLVDQNHFDRAQVNSRLQQYASRDKELMLYEQGIG
ncbi:plasmid pRiA4b ORF-3 family protein [Crinalium epipsammum PCC 9333]|uniref:Plasmid pRiA4b ORF-3 family protein n=1 Tax=Crinalium epipsammum PCC 9333 TaxID=1173022 RepID=K9VUL9_9CYAN|nr:plasmid pRiA4b ORF-3 family protein [Crinalium epipsammum]AFZ11259.1 plasmid pRiA4b ORF-3 family protein [Crinalium epipsammum PCC 9333]